jgi:hypothetical protein
MSPTTNPKALKRALSRSAEPNPKVDPMKKFILAAAVVATLVVPAAASANVERYQEQDATFTVNQPKDSTGQFDNVWRHEFNVTVNPCDGTFEGEAPTYDNGASTPTWTETVTGSFGKGTVSFATKPIGGGATFKVTDAPYNTKVIAESTWTQNIIEMKVSTPKFTDTSDYKNHGQYVKAMGGGSDAAHSCIGMPINSK